MELIKLINLDKKIKKIYDICMDGKSNPINNRKLKEFSIYYDMIWKEIDYHV